MAGQRGIADAHVGNLRKCGLKRGKQLGLELAVETVSCVVLTHIAADVRVEQDRVADAVAVFTKAADGNVDVDACPLVDDAERHRARRAVFVADQFLRVEVVDALILGRFAAKREPLANVLERVEDARAKLA